MMLQPPLSWVPEWLDEVEFSNPVTKAPAQRSET